MLPRIFSGSWINHNFDIWIGHPEDNMAWERIMETRKTLSLYEQSALPDEALLKQAWREIYMAEGSDWFWWYGDEHASANDMEFDNLLRAHLKKVYSLLGKTPPRILDVPIISEERVFVPPVVPVGFINPVLDGEITNYYEWLGSGKIELVHAGAAMHGEAERKAIIDGMSYGFNPDTLFFRLDYVKKLMPYGKKWRFSINFLHPHEIKIEAAVEGRVSSGKVLKKSPDRLEWLEKGETDISSNDCVEVAVRFSEIEARPTAEMRLFIEVESEEGIERWPVRGLLTVEVPTEDFELEHWMV
jgi:hypothetical protein